MIHVNSTKHYMLYIVMFEVNMLNETTLTQFHKQSFWRLTIFQIWELSGNLFVCLLYGISIVSQKLMLNIFILYLGINTYKYIYSLLKVLV